MLEVVFGESAAGSLSLAVGKENHTAVAMSVAYMSDDGNEPSEAEIEKLQREMEERERRNWEVAVPLESSREDIVLFPLALSVGEIDEDGIGPKREGTLAFLMRTYPNMAEEVVKEKMESARNSLKKLLERSAKGEKIRIWSSDNPDEACGAYWLLEQLRPIGFQNLDVTLVKLPDFREQLNGTVVRYTGWGEVEPYLWGEMASLGRKLPANYMSAMAEQWRQLKKENAHLRAVLNGSLVSSDETLYDTFIMQELKKQEEEFWEARLVGSVLGKYQLGIGDTWIAMRIEKFIQDGLLQPITRPEDDWPIYHQMLRKCGVLKGE